MPIRIIDTLKQQNDQPFPIVDSNDIKGGHYTVVDLTARDNIPDVRRSERMLCSVISTGTTYQLIGGVENANWEEFGGSTFTLPQASNTILGGVKVGSNLSIDASGILSASNSYEHPSFEPNNINISSANSGSTIIGNISFLSDSMGHVNTISVETRTLNPSDIGAAVSTHNHDDSYYTKSELLTTSGNNDKIDWSNIKNAPSFTAVGWRSSVAVKSDLDTISNLTVGDCVLVQDDGDGKGAQYYYSGSTDGWIKIADVDFQTYTHPTFVPTFLGLNTSTNQVIDTLDISVDINGHVSSLSATTRNLTPTDIGASPLIHNHDTSYYKKTALALASGTGSEIDWSYLKNVPTFGSGAWLDPVADMTALAAVPTPEQNNLILVQNAGDGYPAQFVYNIDTWVKIADVDFQSYTPSQIKTLYEDNADTNAFTDSEKTKLSNLSDYILPQASSTILGGVKIGDNIILEADGRISAAIAPAPDSQPATAEALGGIRPGTEFNITAEGILSVNSIIADKITTDTNKQFISETEKTKLAGLSNYTHPTYATKTLNLDTTTAQIIDTLNMTSDASGHITGITATTRNLTPTDIGAALDSHYHDDRYDKKTDIIDWSRITNAPSFGGSTNWLTPVLDTSSLSSIVSPIAGSCVLVKDDGDGKAAQYTYTGSAWVKIADVDFQTYTHPTYTVRNINNTFTTNNVLSGITLTSDSVGHITGVSTTSRVLTLADLGYTGATNANNYVLPIANASTLGGFKVGSGLSIDGTGILSATSSYTHPSDGAGSLTALTGANVVSGITVNSLGHVTGTATRQLTAADIGASSTSHTHSDANGVASGFLSTTLYTKLMGLNNYTHPTYTSRSIILNNTGSQVLAALNFTSDVSGHVSAASATYRTLTPADIGAAATAHTHSTATTTADGFMSLEDKIKLDGLSGGGGDYVLPIASNTVLGGVKVGSNLTIDASGVLSASISGGAEGDYVGTISNIDISATHNASFYLSGVRYLNNTDVLNFDVSGLSVLNKSITINPSQFINTINPVNIPNTSITTSTYTDSHIISLPASTFLDTDLHTAEVRYDNWKSSYSKKSPLRGLLVDTYNRDVSTPTCIYARDETKRYNYVFDAPWTAWDSSKPLGPSDLMVQNGHIMRQKGNYNSYIGQTNKNKLNYDIISQSSQTSQFYYTGLHDIWAPQNHGNAMVRIEATRDGVNPLAWSDCNQQVTTSPLMYVWIAFNIMPGTVQWNDPANNDGGDHAWFNMFTPYTGSWINGYGCNGEDAGAGWAAMDAAAGFRIVFDANATNDDSGPDAVKWGFWVKIEIPYYSNATIKKLEVKSFFG